MRHLPRAGSVLGTGEQGVTANTSLPSRTQHPKCHGDKNERSLLNARYNHCPIRSSLCLITSKPQPPAHTSPGPWLRGRTDWGTQERRDHGPASRGGHFPVPGHVLREAQAGGSSDCSPQRGHFSALHTHRGPEQTGTVSGVWAAACGHPWLTLCPW